MRHVAIIDNATERDAIVARLDHQPGVKVVETATTSASAQRIVRARPDTILINQQVDGGQGIALAAELQGQDIHIAVYGDSDPIGALPIGVPFLRADDIDSWPARL